MNLSLCKIQVKHHEAVDIINHFTALTDFPTAKIYVAKIFFFLLIYLIDSMNFSSFTLIQRFLASHEFDLTIPACQIV